jgi:hypothetical protein
MTTATVAPAVAQATVADRLEDLAIREINSPEVEAEITVELAHLAGHLTAEDRAFWFGEYQQALIDRQNADDGNAPAVDCTDEEWADACVRRIDEALQNLTAFKEVPR